MKLGKVLNFSIVIFSQLESNKKSPAYTLFLGGLQVWIVKHLRAGVGFWSLLKVVQKQKLASFKIVNHTLITVPWL